MKQIKWFWIFLVGISLELIYGVYITFIKWYESGVIVDLFSINLLIFIGGCIIGNMVNSRYVLQGALVGVVAALFYVGATLNMVIDGNLPIDFAYFREGILKIISGALGGYAMYKIQLLKGKK